MRIAIIGQQAFGKAVQKTTPIGSEYTIGSVYFNHLFPLGLEAMLEATDLVVAGRHQEVVQDEDAASCEG